jgi:glycosyltransferase involved in cell wall biosynthesis
MQSVIRNTLGRHSTIVYPPVDLTRFRQAKSKERKNLVVAVSRIRPGKHLEIIPQLAKVVKKARFVIVGIADPASWDTIKMLTETVSNLRVGDRVELLVNEPLDKLVDILLSSKVFLHAQPMEAFGMAVIEAMATGCVPIVPRNGGPWYDILNAEEGNYGYSYTNIGDAANLINMLLNDERLRTEVSLRAQRRTLYFENSNFEEKILALVGKICAGV